MLNPKKSSLGISDVLRDERVLSLEILGSVVGIPADSPLMGDSNRLSIAILGYRHFGRLPDAHRGPRILFELF